MSSGLASSMAGMLPEEQTKNKRRVKEIARAQHGQWVRALARASSDATARLSASQPAQADDAMVASKALCTYFSSAYLMIGSWPSCTNDDTTLRRYCRENVCSCI
jgi:hypothetical protein